MSIFDNKIFLMSVVGKKFVILVIILFLSFMLNMSLGSVLFPISVWADVLQRQIPDSLAGILNYRLLKAFSAVLAGGSLALSGLLLQTMFRNPIVGPYVLGLSSGASLGVALLFLSGSFFGYQFSSDMSTALAASIGSVLVLFLIVGLYYKFGDPVNLLIAGLMIGFFVSSLVSILSFFTEATNLQRFVFWSMGSLGNQQIDQLWLLFIGLLFSIGIVLYFFKDLNLLLLGEEYAISMGVSVKKINIMIILITGLLTGSVTAFFGPIGFIGLAVPHLTRYFFQTQMHQILVPVNVLMGAVILLLCDTLAQVPGSVMSLPINSITALFGAPLVVYMLLKNSK